MKVNASLNLDIAQFLVPAREVKRARQLLGATTDMLILESNMYTDIELKAKGGSVKAHRYKLVSFSPIIATLLENLVRSKLKLELHFPPMSIAVLKLLLVLLYGASDLPTTSSLFGAAVDAHFGGIFEACYVFKIIRLLPILNDHLPKHPTHVNCWDWLNKSMDLNKVCQSYVGLERHCQLPRFCAKYILENAIFLDPVLD